jgi:D-3-phosphoglycerate dehydrogenase
MKIVIPDDYQGAVSRLECFTKLAGHEVLIYRDTVKDIDTLVERFHDADALVLIRERTAITAALLERLPRLKLISQTGGGTAHIDITACNERDLTVCAGSGSPVATAELTFALILAALRHIPAEVQHLREGGWQSTLGSTLSGKTLGIYGYGKIGALVAAYGKAFAMQVLVWGRENSLARAQVDGYAVAPNRAVLFAQSDVLSLHLRLSKETRGIVTASDLARMKSSALIVNTARAELIERGALVDALKAGRPGFAAVDVFEEEPVLGAQHPLLQLANAICTPHLGYVEQESYQLYFGQAFDQVLAFASGKPINVVNQPQNRPGNEART